MEHVQQQVSILHKISNIISSGQTIDEMLDELIAISIEITRCDAGLVYLLDKASGEMVLRASQLPHDKELGQIRIKMGEGVTGWVAEHRAVVALSEHSPEDKRFKRFSTLIEDTFEAFLSVPLVSGGELIGVLNTHHRSIHQHSSAEVALMTFVGEQMGVAIAKSVLVDENSKLMEEALELKKQLETRKFVERAKGILQSKYGLTEEEAYLKLRNESRRLRKPMRDLAEAIIIAEDLGRKASGESEAVADPPDSMMPGKPV
ncbi:MAG: GAF domain-containing protein [Bryobacterales bacterium]|nr:GAF domain-containing protein [Bryobacterales bacterium]